MPGKKFTIRDAKKALGENYTEAEYEAKLKKVKKTSTKDILKKLGYNPDNDE